MTKITGLSHIFKWENLHNWWLTKYFFCPTVYVFGPDEGVLACATGSELLGEDYLLHYQVLPFGLHRARATFQRLMDRVLWEHIEISADVRRAI